MYRFLKTILLYYYVKNSIKNLITILFCLFLVIFTTYIFDDLFSVLEQKEKLNYLTYKWIIIFILISIIIFNCFKLVANFRKKTKENIDIEKPFPVKEKEMIHKKEILDELFFLTKSDQIKNKYKNKK